MARALLPIATFLAALIVPQQSITAARPASDITDLGTLGGDYSDAFRINNDPSVLQVVGQSRTASGAVHAFVWTAPGPMIDLGTLAGGRESLALDINAYGQIAGLARDALWQQWAVVWTNAGGRWAIENIGTATGGCCAAAHGINDGIAGDPSTVAVAGVSVVSSGESHAVIWTRSDTGWSVQDLGTTSGDTFSVAEDINDQRAVVGISGSRFGPASGFLWTAATGMVRLSTLGGETYALAVNDRGDVAGLSTTASGDRHAVRWQAATNWRIEDLGTLGGCCSEAYGINSLGDVVGVSNVSRRTGLQHAFLVPSMSTGMTDLGALRGNSAARALNDFGVVVGGGSTGKSVHALMWRLP